VSALAVGDAEEPEAPVLAGGKDRLGVAADAEGGYPIGVAFERPEALAGGPIGKLRDGDTVRIVIDRNKGDIWIGTAKGVNRYGPGEASTATETGVRPLTVYPNPIRQSVIGIAFTVRDADGEPMVRTDVNVYGTAGRFLTQLRTDDTGNLNWVPEDRFGRHLPPGVYFLQALGFDEEGRRKATGNGRLVITP
jgi:hypothetical protein